MKIFINNFLKKIIKTITSKKVNKFKHFNGVLDYEKIQSKYDDIW
jgi:hypothetical protein